MCCFSIFLKLIVVHILSLKDSHNFRNEKLKPSLDLIRISVLVNICAHAVTLCPSRAAFQYGVKMADGRKTRRTGPKDEKKELDREWQKIQNIMNKRKQTGTDGEPYSKMSKY